MIFFKQKIRKVVSNEEKILKKQNQRASFWFFPFFNLGTTRGKVDSSPTLKRFLAHTHIIFFVFIFFTTFCESFSILSIKNKKFRREVIVTGGVENVRRGLKEMFKLLLNDAQELQIKVMCLPAQISTCLGKNGQNIKDIRESTGCRLKCFSEEEIIYYAPDRVVQIEGTKNKKSVFDTYFEPKTITKRFCNFRSHTRRRRGLYSARGPPREAGYGKAHRPSRSMYLQQHFFCFFFCYLFVFCFQFSICFSPDQNCVANFKIGEKRCLREKAKARARVAVMVVK